MGLTTAQEQDALGITIIDKVNSYLTYTGKSFTGVLESDPVWQISRTITLGAITKTEYIDGGRFTQIWDDRTTLFTPTPFFNQLSTSFDGVNDYIDFGNNYSFETSIAFSLSIWIKPQNFSAPRYIISKLRNQNPSYEGYTIGIDTNGKIYSQVRSVSSTLGFTTFNTTLTADVWTHVVWVWTGASNQSGQRLYVNGALDSATPVGSALVGTWASSEPLVLGRRLTTNYFVGKMDEFSIYDKALSASEVTDIFNGGIPNDLTTLPSVGNLQSWWRLGDGDTFPNTLDQVNSVNGVLNNMTAANFVADIP